MFYPVTKHSIVHISSYLFIKSNDMFGNSSADNNSVSLCMLSYKIVLRMNKANSLGRAPLVLQLIYKRRSTEISLKKYLEPKHWDFKKCVVKKTYHNYNTLNLYLRKQLRKIETISDNKLYEGVNFTLKDIVNEFKGVNPSESEITFSSYFEEHIDACKGKLRFGSVQNFKVAKRKWDEVHKDVLLKDVSKKHIELLEKHLKTKYGIAQNTLQKRMSNIKTICLKAVNEKLLSENPFKGLQYRKAKSNRQALSKDDVQQLIDLKGLTPGQELTRDLFLYSCLTGLRFGDLCNIKYSDIENKIGKEFSAKVIVKVANKTGTRLFIPLSKEAISIQEKYNSTGIGLIFPLLSTKDLETDEKLKKAISRANALANKQLKAIAKKADITKPLSTHIARITFATELGNNPIIPITVTKDLLGHGDLRTTLGYVKSDIDKMAKAVELINYNTVT